jgi:hypothetical protein
MRHLRSPVFKGDFIKQWCRLLLLLALSPAALYATTSKIIVDGFVTHSGSATSFEIAAWRFAINSRTACRSAMYIADLHKPWSDRISYAQPFEPSTAEARQSKIACDNLQLRIGSRVRVIGEPYTSGRILAKEIINFIGVSHKDLASIAIMEEKPECRFSAKGQHCTLWIDGYPIIATEETAVYALPASTSIGYRNAVNLENTSLSIAFRSRQKVKMQSTQALPRQNDYVAYHAYRDRNNRINASSIQYWPNCYNIEAQAFLRKFTPKESPFDGTLPSNLNFGVTWLDGIRFTNSTVNIILDDSIQRYVSRLGSLLSPKLENDCRGTCTGNLKIRVVVTRFMKCCDSRIYVINDAIKQSDRDSVIAFPNGLIMVPDVILTRLRTEADLVFLLSSAIASVIQKQTLIAWPFINKAARLDGNYSVTRTVSFLHEEQLLRVGIRQMYLAGYDIREAPYAWAVAQGRPVNNPVIDSKDPDKEIPWYAAYAFNYISQYYKDVDYSKLKRGEKEYQQFLQELRKADPEAFAPQKAVSGQTAKVH